MKNLQILIGHLGQAPETINFDNGGKITKFSLATSESWKDKQTGERKTDTQWHNIVAGHHFTELCERHLKKGSKVYIEGITKHRMYEQDGIKKYITEVHMRNLVFLDSKQQSQQTQNQPQSQAQGVKDDDLMF